MKNIIYFTSKNGNYYLYNSFHKKLHCIDNISWQIVKLLDENGVHLLDENEQVILLLKDNYNIKITSSLFDRYKSKIFYYIDGYGGELYASKPITNIQQEAIKYMLSNNPHIVFEVTERCNLECKYCGYGDFYQGFEPRKGKDLDVQLAKSIIKYVFDSVNSDYSVSAKQTIVITFYGGEPLLRFDFITIIVLFAKELQTSNISFSFRMTTNAVLLDKYIDFLQENEFQLLVSLDGNRNNHSYRIFKNGKESFPIVVRNVKYAKNKYPKYFKEKVEFNSVLHNRNSIQEIQNFIIHNFEKKPSIKELSTDGILEERKIELLKIFKNMYEHVHSSEDYFQQLYDTDFSSMPDYIEAMNFIYYMYNLSYFDYKHLFLGFPRYIQPTATCVPFERKVFITANGKILPCENTPHEYYMGFIDEDGVHIDFEKIANQYSSYLERINTICKTCYRIANCIQCMFSLELNKNEQIHCYGYLDKKKFAKYLERIVSYMENYPETFNDVMIDTFIR